MFIKRVASKDHYSSFVYQNRHRYMVSRGSHDIYTSYFISVADSPPKNMKQTDLEKNQAVDRIIIPFKGRR